MEIEPTKLATLIYLIDKENKTVLMAKKTRKVGVGYWFGYGGKIEEGENPEESAAREVLEESGGIRINSNDLEKIALIDFYKGIDRPFGYPTFRVLCYRAFSWQGEPVSTPEMDDPTHFPIDNIPWDEMKSGDELFLKSLLAGNPVKGWIRFTHDSKQVIGSDIQPCLIEDLVI